MDAIELPLAHPHLFPPGSSRSGILLFGPPGTGKTLVAKAVATECKLPFLSVKGPELLGSYVGESEANVRIIFREARDRGSRNKPPACVLFFDEMESLAPKRGEQGSSGGNVMDRVVATLFGEMDRNSTECQTFCIGATNRPDLLDTAMLRPGRFDRLVYLGIQKADYTKILTAQLRNVKVEGDLELIATAVADILPPTMTGADLSAIVSSALLRATYRLCEKADNEQKRLREKGKDVALDEILRNWTEEESEPVVVLYDLISAANEATPSLTEAELAQYENLMQVMNVS
uniref:AAA+ ATPase domain-containing protein n=1 Tax=Amphora coffeiformis TaxID=265554 RepID=A0A7S3L5N7_9STRA|eukprot:scaffold1953_cov176-Amphora_coffeaeformis.AAC.1